MSKNRRRNPASELALQDGIKNGVNHSHDFPHSNLTENLHKFKVASLLLSGKSNAIPGKDLVNLLNLRNPRELTKLIESERRSGAPICASTDSSIPGYFIATDAAELAQYVQSLDRRLFQIRKTRQACGDTLEKMTGQQKMEDL